jgi:4'-phosphopantetheinyl transferase
MKTPINEVDVLYVNFIDPFPNEYLSFYLNLLTNNERKKALKYIKWQDQHAYILGRLLLMKGLHKYGYDRTILSRIEFTKYGKPFIREPFNFNISHCEGNVICAITKNGSIGVDIELPKELNIEDFINTMTLSQLRLIRNSKNPLKSFYKLWVAKESIIKADGRGLSIPLNKIKPKNKMFKYEGIVWYLRELLLEESDICASLASSQPIDQVNFIKVDFTGLSLSETTTMLQCSFRNFI